MEVSVWVGGETHLNSSQVLKYYSVIVAWVMIRSDVNVERLINLHSTLLTRGVGLQVRLGDSLRKRVAQSGLLQILAKLGPCHASGYTADLTTAEVLNLIIGSN